MRQQRKQLNETFRFLAEVVGEKGAPDFAEDEKEDDFSTIWVAQDQAEKLVKKNFHSTNLYHNYITQRALLFLNEAKFIL